jgi:hypothetical protein
VMIVPEAADGPAHRAGDVRPDGVAQQAAHFLYAAGLNVPEDLRAGKGGSSL